ncbi:unnamed protein product [Cyclocybe aegerita]|uniref:Uncharacterized protein n=1 Tax=Cyclocybe aegerita TaxID=1973307 RepID=A0A8S0VT34_CYCAE|nr:unnamed protein product [Cyclocybe aegerita]
MYFLHIIRVLGGNTASLHLKEGSWVLAKPNGKISGEWSHQRRRHEELAEGQGSSDAREMARMPLWSWQKCEEGDATHKWGGSGCTSAAAVVELAEVQSGGAAHETVRSSQWSWQKCEHQDSSAAHEMARPAGPAEVQGTKVVALAKG